MPRSNIDIKASFEKIDEKVPAVDHEKTIILTINSAVLLIDGKYVENDVAPMIRDEEVFLPIRVIAETIGALVTWNKAEQKVTITKDDMLIELFIQKSFAIVNGIHVELDVPVFIENCRTYLPLHFIMEHLDANAVWDPLTLTLTVTG